MNEPSKKQRKLDFKPSQKRKSTSSTPASSSARSSPQKGGRLANSVTDVKPLSINPLAASVNQNVQTMNDARTMLHNVTMNGVPVRLQAGPKRLVVKNLRPPKNVDMTEHFEKTQEQIEDATWAIFQGRTPELPLTTLAKDIEDQVRDGRGEKLKEKLDASLTEYLCEVATRVISNGKQATLWCAINEWKNWMEVTTKLRSLFAFFDHAYLLHCRPTTSLLEVCINAFKYSALSQRDVRDHIYYQINQIIDNARRTSINLPDEESHRLTTAINMLTNTKLYKAEFEPALLQASAKYFEACAREPMPLEKYITNVVELLNEEAERCTTHGFNSTTRVALLKLGRAAFILDRQEYLLQGEKIGSIIQKGDIDTIKALYDLFQSCDIADKLRGPWEAFIKKRGNEICAAKENSDKLINAVLEFKMLCDSFLTEAFGTDPGFKKSMRSAFVSFINARHAKHPWGMGGDKVGELLAKYVDLLLRGGLNAVPESLLRPPTPAASDADLVEEYKASEFDRQIDLVLDLFRHIDGKDTFLSYYKLHLARRLLNGRYLSEDTEKAMIAKLEKESGEDYIKDLVTMFKDIDSSKVELAAYNEEVWKGRSRRLELGVNMLTSTAWPSYPEESVNVPHVVAKEIERFDEWYGKAHTGRKLTWKHSLAQCEIRANLPNGKKYLVIGGFQAIVLDLFNGVGDTESLGYAQIQEATGLPNNELDRTLASLACGKQQILIKDPPAGGIAITDTFKVNLGFTAKSNRVKIPQVALRDTRLDEVAAVKKVNMDRDFEVQGAIVRVLKRAHADGGTRLGWDELILATNEEIMQNGRGAVTVEEVEKHTKKLIGKDFIDVENGQYLYLP